jgi:hypothetical protein
LDDCLADLSFSLPNLNSEQSAVARRREIFKGIWLGFSFNQKIMRSALHSRRDDEMDSTDGDDRDPLLLRSSSENALRQMATDYGSTPSNRLLTHVPSTSRRADGSRSTKRTPRMASYSPSQRRARNTRHNITTCCCPQNDYGDESVATSDDGEDEFEFVLNAKEKLLGKTDHFDLPNSPERGFRAITFSVFRMSRPYMRAMHASWVCFFASYSVQFAMAPLLPQLEVSLNLSKQDIWLVSCGACRFDFGLSSINNDSQ